MNVKPGDNFGRLTVVDTEVVYDHRQRRTFVICQCDCGSPPIRVRLDGLCKPDNSSRKPARSCGCLQRDAVTKHGAWNDPLYRVWKSMHERCYDPNHQRYYCYGERGITVCKRWHDVNNFISDMAEGYQKGLQIDRRDNDKGYSKENCHWVTRTQQARNKSSNVQITFNGETHCLKEWSQITGLIYGTLVERIQVLGWPPEKALTQPARKGNYVRKQNLKT
jgi:hypothetical protein